jgi:Cell wall-active antibiotics response 4TMS YvqF
MSEPPRPAPPEPTEPQRTADTAPRAFPRDRRWSLGTVVVGLLLVLLGVAWLLESLDVLEVPWGTLLPIALIVVGGALLLSARRERPRGLIVAGLILTVLSAATSAGDIGFGGVGERAYRPASLSELQAVPDLGVGELRLDLRRLTPSAAARGAEEIDVSVGIGELQVLLPPDLPVRIRASAGIGEVELPDGSEGGFGAEAQFPDGGATGDQLYLELSVGIGQVTVSR